jgi:solute:Na+ symporter, SSS family
MAARQLPRARLRTGPPMLHPVDIAIFLAFFALVIAVSLRHGRREQTSEGYFLAGRGLHWTLIGLSIVAANISTEQFVGMAGQAAGTVGLAVSAWQLTGSIGIVIVAFVFLPRFLRSGIYTMPEYLEYRYNAGARALMALFTVLIYVGVTITAVLYSGGLAMQTIFGIDMTAAVWLIGGIAALYTTWGGLKAVAWADLFLGSALILGGLATMAFGFQAVGGVEAFFTQNADRLRMILPSDHPLLPWTGILFGMWIPILYYTGLNQYIVQRTLAARSLREGQLGVIFAGALWLLVPFAIVFPGIMASQLYGDQLARPDEAYPMLIRNLIPVGVRGFMFAAIAGAVISSLASMLNSASTIFTMDLFGRHLRPSASERTLVATGRLMTIVFVVVGCALAPFLAHPRFQGVFHFIQEFQGYISPGIVAAFLVGFAVPRAPAAAGVAALLASAPLYGLLQWQYGDVHFLLRMTTTFSAVTVLMLGITAWRPLAAPRVMPVRVEMDLSTSPLVAWAGAAVVAGAVLFFVIFW